MISKSLKKLLMKSLEWGYEKLHALTIRDSFPLIGFYLDKMISISYHHSME